MNSISTRLPSAFTYLSVICRLSLCWQGPTSPWPQWATAPPATSSFSNLIQTVVVGNRLGERWRARGVVRTCGGPAATCLQDSTAQERNVQLLKPSCNVESSNQHDLTICRASSSTVLTTTKNHPVKTLSHQRNQSA